MFRFLDHNHGPSLFYYSPMVKDLGEGNPLIRLSDDRLCLTYAVRAVPYRIYCQLSSDKGKTWTNPVVLRDDVWCQGYRLCALGAAAGRKGGDSLLFSG